MANKLKMYVTSTCSVCKVAKRRLDAAGLPYSVVNVEEDAEAHARLKAQGRTTAPIFGWKGALHQMDAFPTILKELAEQEAAA